MTHSTEPVSANAEPVLENPVQLQYDGTGNIMVKGKQTGNLYIFGAGDPAIPVDGRDLQEILSRSGEFSLNKKSPTT